jgi:hypothetical protein
MRIVAMSAEGDIVHAVVHDIDIHQTWFRVNSKL